MLNDAWMWTDYQSTDGKFHGFCGENEQVTMLLTVDVEHASGVWHELITFNDVDAGKRKPTPKSVSDLHVMTVVPKPWWTKVASLTQNCCDNSANKLDAARKRAFAAIEKGRSPTKVMTESRLEAKTTAHHQLSERTELLHDIAAGIKPVTLLYPEPPKPSSPGTGKVTSIKPAR